MREREKKKRGVTTRAEKQKDQEKSKERKTNSRLVSFSLLRTKNREKKTSCAPWRKAR